VEASAKIENTIISKSICLAQISLFCSKKVAQLITNSTVFTALKNPSILNLYYKLTKE